MISLSEIRGNHRLAVSVRCHATLLSRFMSRHLASLGANVVVMGKTFRDAGTPRITFIQAD